MKHFYPLLLSFLCAITLGIYSCILEKEPDIPTDTNNVINPGFLSTEITPDSNNIFQAKVWLSGNGNLNILQHGWVWSEAPAPTLQNDKLELGRLTADTFLAEISGLDTGKIFYLRPYVTTGMGTVYGPERCSFLGVDFTINTDTEIFRGAHVQFTNRSTGNFTYLWDFGDGTTSTDFSPPVHIFNTPGNATVQLTVGFGSCQITKTLVLRVLPNPFEGYWVSIPGGTFMMGCTEDQDTTDEEMCYDDEGPLHQNTVTAFIIGRTEITQGQWFAVMGDNPSDNVCMPDCPVENVSWDMIVNQFIPALYRKTGQTYRLPSEAEWEYAAYGGEMFKYSGSDSLDLVGWYAANAGDKSRPVATRMPNGYGLYDMNGNLWEWVEDDWHVGYLGAPADGSAWIDTPRGEERVFRGGSWMHDPELCRLYTRFKQLTDFKEIDIGFRLVRSN